jgi:hypothetical protein
MLVEAMLVQLPCIRDKGKQGVHEGKLGYEVEAGNLTRSIVTLMWMFYS